jgi:hypothetical protein
VASPYLTVDQLRALTGFCVGEGQDWCGECAAAVRRFAGPFEDEREREGASPGDILEA